jgi:hypothetical protein
MQATTPTTKSGECRPFGQQSVLMTSGLMVWNAYCGRCNKLLLGLGLTATGTMITTGIATMKRLVAISGENIVTSHIA